MADLDAAADGHAASARAANTRLAYASDWRKFEAWCAARGAVPLPAAPETVRAYLTSQAAATLPRGRRAYSPSTMGRWLSSITDQHKRAGHASPAKHPDVEAVLSGIRRQMAKPPRQMAPLLVEDIKKVLAQIDITTWPAAVGGRRDSALLLMGFAGAFRRSELSALLVGDILHRRDGLHAIVRKSKTDQNAEGFRKGLPFGSTAQTCPPCAFDRWMRMLIAETTGGRVAAIALLNDYDVDPRNHTCGTPLTGPEMEPYLDTPVFRPVTKGGVIGDAAMSGQAIALVVKRRAADAKIQGLMAGHSLRAGFVTQAFSEGNDAHRIMRQTGHKNPVNVEIYSRENDPLHNNAVTNVGL